MLEYFISLGIKTGVMIRQYLFERELDKELTLACEENKKAHNKLMTTLDTEEAQNLLKSIFNPDNVF